MNQQKPHSHKNKSAPMGTRFISFLLATIFLLTCLSACIEEKQPTNEELIEDRITAFVTAYNDGDMETVLSCLDAKTRNAFQAMLNILGGLAGSAAGFNIDLSDLFSLGVSTTSGDFMELEITNVTVIDSSNATATTEMFLTGAGTQIIYFEMVYENNGWYIHDMTDRKTPDLDNDQGNDTDTGDSSNTDGTINDSENDIVEISYEISECEPFIDGRAWVKYYEKSKNQYTKTYHYGFIDQEGNVLYSLPVEDVKIFNIGKGSAIIISENGLILIDKNGEVKMELDGHAELKQYGDGYAWIYQNKSTITSLEHLYGIVDYQGKWIKPLENLQKEGLYNKLKHVGDGFFAATGRNSIEYPIYSSNNDIEILITGVLSDWHLEFSNGVAYIPTGCHASHLTAVQNGISITVTKRNEDGSSCTETYSNIKEDYIIYADGRVVNINIGDYHRVKFNNGKIIVNEIEGEYYQITDYTKATPYTFEFTAYPVSQIEKFVFNGDYGLVQIRGLDKEVYITMIDTQGNELITPIKGLSIDNVILAPNGYIYYRENNVYRIVDKNNNIIDTDINWYVSFNGNSEIGMVSNYYNGIYYIKLNGEKLFETLVVDQE